MNLEKIRQIAAEEMENRSSHPWKEPGNKFFHGERTAKLALTLRKKLFPKDASHDDVLTVAAWFHDIRNGEEDHEAKGAQAVRQLLSEQCSAEELDEICGMIALHDDRSAAHNSYPQHLRLLQDADLLDHFGSYDVWMNFAYAAMHRQTLQQIVEFFSVKRPAEEQRYLGELNFSLSRSIFCEKAEFLRSFIERFRAECDGEIWNWQAIVQDEVEKTSNNV